MSILKLASFWLCFPGTQMNLFSRNVHEDILQFCIYLSHRRADPSTCDTVQCYQGKTTACRFFDTRLLVTNWREQIREIRRKKRMVTSLNCEQVSTARVCLSLNWSPEPVNLLSMAEKYCVDATRTRMPRERQAAKHNIPPFPFGNLSDYF